MASQDKNLELQKPEHGAEVAVGANDSPVAAVKIFAGLSGVTYFSDSKEFVVKGWVSNPECVSSLAVLTEDGEEIYSGPPNVQRRDIAMKYNITSGLPNGFHFSFLHEFSSEDITIKLIVKLVSGLEPVTVSGRAKILHSISAQPGDINDVLRSDITQAPVARLNEVAIDPRIIGAMDTLDQYLRLWGGAPLTSGLVTRITGLTDEEVTRNLAHFEEVMVSFYKQREELSWPFHVNENNVATTIDF